MKQHGLFRTVDDSAGVETGMHLVSGRQASVVDGDHHVRQEQRKAKKTEKEQPEGEKKTPG